MFGSVQNILKSVLLFLESDNIDFEFFAEITALKSSSIKFNNLFIKHSLELLNMSLVKSIAFNSLFFEKFNLQLQLLVGFVELCISN